MSKRAFKTGFQGTIGKVSKTLRKLEQISM